MKIIAQQDIQTQTTKGIMHLPVCDDRPSGWDGVRTVRGDLPVDAHERTYTHDNHLFFG